MWRLRRSERGGCGQRQVCGVVCLLGRPGWDADRLVMSSSLDDSDQGVWRRAVLGHEPHGVKEQETWGFKAHGVCFSWLGSSLESFLLRE